MADYGYLNRTFIENRDDKAIDAIFSSVHGDHVVVEQEWTSGAEKRPAFKKMLTTLKPEDVLFISSFDRLGLDAEDSVRLWRVITQEKGADIVVLDEPSLDSRNDLSFTDEQLLALAQAAFAALAANARS